MKDLLKSIVENLLVKHTGGTAYFDELDDIVSHPVFFKEIFKYVPIHNSRTAIISSGDFGMKLAKWFRTSIPGMNFYQQRPSSFIMFNGGLRKDAVPVFKSWKWPDRIKNCMNIIYVDDSFYSGKTRDICDARLKEIYDVNITETFVVYDGAEKNTVGSLYRYYDHHNGE